PDGLPQQIFWLIVAPCVDPAFRDLIARANDNLLHHYVDAALLVRILGDTPQRRKQVLQHTSPGGTFERLGLVGLTRRDSQPNPLHQELAPHHDVVGRVLGLRTLSAPLTQVAPISGLAVRHTVPMKLADVLLSDVVDTLADVIRQWRRRHAPGHCVLVAGRPGVGRTTHVLGAATRAGCGVLVADLAALLPNDPGAAEALDHLCRESWLHGDVIVLRDAGATLVPGSAWPGRLRASIERWPALVFVCVDETDRIDASLAG